MVPSLPLLLGSPWTRLCWVCVLPETTMFNLPRICIRSFAGASFARFARISVSRICSISPAPNTGVGILKITFFLFASKSGCVSWQPTVPAAPTMVNRSCTPPSGVPLLAFWNLASGVGPPGASLGLDLQVHGVAGNRSGHQQGDRIALVFGRHRERDFVAVDGAFGDGPGLALGIRHGAGDGRAVGLQFQHDVGAGSFHRPFPLAGDVGGQDA